MISTRGRRAGTYTLITPENHYASRLPSLPGARVIKLVTPRLAPARFGQYLVLPAAAGLRGSLPGGREDFLFLLDGDAEVRLTGATTALGAREFAYAAPGDDVTLTAGADTRLLWITRHHEPWPGHDDPASRSGRVSVLAAQGTATPGLTRRELLDPTDVRLDFNISLMTFAPGATLDFVEIHDEEHGLYMTAGGGRYVLDGDEHEVRADDFIYMSPYCPQWFQAGESGAEYLLYKDVHRDGF
jgi:(S)-ureidoglycine aminohydrolase